MKYLSKTFLVILSTFILIILSACSKSEVIAVSELHPYKQNFGVLQNHQADEVIRQELMAMHQPTQIDTPEILDPEISTELTVDSDAFLAHEYVPTAPVISYKYKFDSKFYSKAEWRTMDLE
ncbi:MAG: Unknown protein [uncultured Sulfurovum sp.]|uniref:Lipoprotein n=1 Tax=uncultured Sulfurovum sp. TaxID=269237 RepID=A0A6S6U1R7_9BACT|nr:MAG: Unknown protein [uncultured Sulfurovum sp.]